jgi:hypothetical protein
MHVSIPSIFSCHSGCRYESRGGARRSSSDIRRTSERGNLSAGGQTVSRSRGRNHPAVLSGHARSSCPIVAVSLKRRIALERDEFLKLRTSAEYPDGTTLAYLSIAWQRGSRRGSAGSPSSAFISRSGRHLARTQASINACSRSLDKIIERILQWFQYNSGPNRLLLATSVR